MRKGKEASDLDKMQPLDEITLASTIQQFHSNTVINL
jgi:hypothetical protein